jgi:hypothetical protein
MESEILEYSTFNELIEFNESDPNFFDSLLNIFQSQFEESLDKLQDSLYFMSFNLACVKISNF